MLKIRVNNIRTAMLVEDVVYYGTFLTTLVATIVIGRKLGIKA